MEVGGDEKSVNGGSDIKLMVAFHLQTPGGPIVST
jgi:hypothetical protein